MTSRYQMRLRRMRCMKLETACVYFASINIIIKVIILILGISGNNSIILSLVSLGPSPPKEQSEDFTDEFFYENDEDLMALIRGALIVDCILSIFYSVLLIVGVKRNSICLMKSCFIYGIVILILSSIVCVPRFMKMVIENDFVYFGQRSQALVLTIISGVQVLVVLKTYRKFQKVEDMQKLLLKRSEQRKKDLEMDIADSRL